MQRYTHNNNNYSGPSRHHQQQQSSRYNVPSRQLQSPSTSCAPAKEKTINIDKLREISRCCICFENYSLNSRAPICAPCGHTFCCVCVRKLCHGNLVCCCICRKVSFFGPTELGKNIQLLDVLENVQLLDPDGAVPPQLPNSSAFPENSLEGVEERDIIKFLNFCFSFVKEFYKNKQENLVTTYALQNGGGRDIHEYSQRLFGVRNNLSSTMHDLINRFNECLVVMDASDIQQDLPRIISPAYGGFENAYDDDNDPFGIETAYPMFLIQPAPGYVFDRRATSTPEELANDFQDNRSYMFDDENASNFEEYDPRNDEDYDDFRPNTWNPLSRLFTIPTTRHHNTTRNRPRRDAWRRNDWQS